MVWAFSSVPIFIVTEPEPSVPEAPPRVIRLPRVDLRSAYKGERETKRHNDAVRQEIRAKVVEFR